jgi:hypothetical protein
MSARNTCPVCWRTIYLTSCGLVGRHCDRFDNVCLASGTRHPRGSVADKLSVTPKE